MVKSLHYRGIIVLADYIRDLIIVIVYYAEDKIILHSYEVSYTISNEYQHTNVLFKQINTR